MDQDGDLDFVTGEQKDSAAYKFGKMIIRQILSAM